MTRFLITFFFLVSLCFSAFSQAAITDIKFGSSQIADSQWNVGACLYTTTCQIYSKAPGTAYKIPWTSGRLTWAAGDYVKFELSGNASFPYLAKQYNSNGTLKTTMGSGKIVNMGPDYFFFVGSDNNTGQLFSGSLGMNNTSGVTWTGTLNPTITQADAYAGSNYSVTPLAAGQTAAPAAPPPPPTVTITVDQQNRVNAARARQTYKNEVNIDQIGNYNSIDVIQSGFYHLVDVTVAGDSNILDIGQYGIKNYAKVHIQGGGNSLNTHQGNTGVGAGHFSEMLISGNNNTIVNNQSGNGEKISFISNNGNANAISSTQSGNGTKYSDIKATGNGHTVMLDQKDGGAHGARIEVTNNGGSSNINVLQQGNANQTYSIQQSCATVGGCSVTVTQQ
jgi:hypothetical protein